MIGSFGNAYGTTFGACKMILSAILRPSCRRLRVACGRPGGGAVLGAPKNIRQTIKSEK